MGPGSFIIAILGCSDGATACTPVMTVPTRFESEAACTAAAPEALFANSNFDFRSLLAVCRPAGRREAADLGADEVPGAAIKA